MRAELRRTFPAEGLTLDEQTFASIAPLEGEVVGVGMPVVVAFDVAVTDRAEIEEHLAVTSRPAQRGSWHRISENEVHWRPRSYWLPGTDVTVTADVNGVAAGNGIYGQEDREVTFQVGDALVMQIDVPRHTMLVRRNGELLRTIPVSAGKAGFTTRSGVKVIMEKFRHKRMDAATTGISRYDPECRRCSCRRSRPGEVPVAVSVLRHRRCRVRAARHLLRGVPPSRPRRRLAS